MFIVEKLEIRAKRKEGKFCSLPFTYNVLHLPWQYIWITCTLLHRLGFFILSTIGIWAG